MIFKRIFLKEEFRGEVRKKFNMENIEIALPKDEKENEN